MRCEVLIFSGRKNPAWEVSGPMVAEAAAALAVAPAATGTLPPPALGYAGCLLSSDETSHRVFNGLIEVTPAGLPPYYLQDHRRRLERGLLQSAPPRFAAILNAITWPVE